MSDPWPSLEANKDREPPYGWIQWKGTDVCMDVHCACGAMMHVDGCFLYYIKCPHCGAVYECGGHITLYPIDEATARAHSASGPHLLDPD